MYVNDYKYEKFLMDIQYLIDNKKEFEKLASIVYDNLMQNVTKSNSKE